MKVEIVGDGRGPRIALLPGLGARGEGFRELATLLTPRATSLLVEYPVGPQANTGAMALADELHRAVGPVDAIVASSMAGLVAARFVERRLVRGVAFVSSFTHLSQLGGRKRLFPLMGPIARFARPSRVAATIASWKRVALRDVATIVPTTAPERLGVWHRARAVHREVTRSHPIPEEIACVAIHGDRDALLPLSVLGRLGATLPDGTLLHVLKGAGHVPYWSHAREVRALLDPWLDEVERRLAEVQRDVGDGGGRASTA